MINKYRVWVYKVVAKAKMDILAYSGLEAKEKVLTACKQGMLHFKNRDELIAVEFEIKDGG